MIFFREYSKYIYLLDQNILTPSRKVYQKIAAISHTHSRFTSPSFPLKTKEPSSEFFESAGKFQMFILFSNARTFTNADETGEQEEKLNIFSLASGHLYERFLKIMMYSVMKHTKTPVKFWFLKNYLSPTLKVNFIRLTYQV